jgi:hypothetical protein
MSDPPPADGREVNPINSIDIRRRGSPAVSRTNVKRHE